MTFSIGTATFFSPMPRKPPTPMIAATIPPSFLHDQVVDVTDALVVAVIDRLADIGIGADLVRGLLGQVAVATCLSCHRCSERAPEPARHHLPEPLASPARPAQAMPGRRAQTASEQRGLLAAVAALRECRRCEGRGKQGASGNGRQKFACHIEPTFVFMSDPGPAAPVFSGISAYAGSRMK